MSLAKHGTQELVLPLQTPAWLRKQKLPPSPQGLGTSLPNSKTGPVTTGIHLDHQVTELQAEPQDVGQLHKDRHQVQVSFHSQRPCQLFCQGAYSSGAVQQCPAMTASPGLLFAAQRPTFTRGY